MIILIIFVLTLVVIALICYFSIKHVTYSKKPEDLDISRMNNLIAQLKIIKLHSKNPDIETRLSKMIEKLRYSDYISASDKKIKSNEMNILECVDSLSKAIDSKDDDTAIKLIDEINMLIDERIIMIKNNK